MSMCMILNIVDSQLLVAAGEGCACELLYYMFHQYGDRYDGKIQTWQWHSYCLSAGVHRPTGTIDIL